MPQMELGCLRAVWWVVICLLLLVATGLFCGCSAEDTEPLGRYAGANGEAVYLFEKSGKVTATLAGVTFGGKYRQEGQRLTMTFDTKAGKDVQKATLSGDTLLVEVGGDFAPFVLMKQTK